jgi:hypothetical protein
VQGERRTVYGEDQPRYAVHLTPYTGLLPGSFLDRGLGFAGVDPLLNRGPLVVLFFPLADRDLDFHKTLLEIQPERDDRDPLAPHLPHQPVDLIALEEKLTRTDRINLLMPLDPGIGRNMTIQKERLFLHYTDIAVLQVHAPLTNGFNLMARQADTGLIAIMDKVVKVGLAILGDHLEGITDRLCRGSRFFFLFHI